MYQQPAHIRSFRGGQNRFSRPSPSGHFGNQRNFLGRKQRSLPNNPVLFIKKASVNSSSNEYLPKNTFKDFNLTPILLSNIDYKKYNVPTPIQDAAIPVILEGKDLIGLAATGTGKTAAFLIPLIQKMYQDRSQKTLIITPTRELALQIRDEFKDFSYDMKLYSSLIIGGANLNRQVHEIRKNPHIVIATPGRLKDLVEHKEIYLEDYNNIVLDEVDLMVDIGFINEVKFFLSFLPHERQSLFFSATISPKIREILTNFVKNPITVSVKTADTAENVDQDVVRVANSAQKIDKLHDLLISDGFDKVLIFGKTKHGIEKLQKELDFRGFKVGAIHGNKTQGHRMRILQSFKNNQIDVLLATDVASRGLDIPNVSHVINYDLPQTYDDYVHRIGRTGRAGKTGVALTFVESYV